MADNPFTLVYNELWVMAERNSALTDLIPPGNRVKFDDELGMKKNVSSSDKPELMLMETGGNGNVQASSSQSEIAKEYTWMISTGTKNINRMHGQISWELFRSMIDWDRFLCALTWDTYSGFVLRMEYGTTDTGELLVPQTRRIQGWASTVFCRVEMSLPTSLLRIPDPP